MGRNRERLTTVAEAIRSAGGASQPFLCELDDDAALEALAAEVAQRFGELHVLVHSAGVFRYGALAAAPVADLDAVYRTNVRAPFLLTQKLLKPLRDAHGTVVFINSGAGERVLPRFGHYCASKFALRALADALRLEEAENGVRVLSVMLGRTATPMQEEVCRLEGVEYVPGKCLAPEDVAATILETVLDAPHIENLQLRPSPV